MWLGTKYFNIKKYLEEEAHVNDCNELTRKHSEIFVDGKVDKTKLLANYDDKCVKVRVLEDALIKATSEHEQGWNNIMVVVDDSLPKPRLNFDEYPPELVAANNLMLTYQNLMTKVLSTGDRALQFKPRGLPVKVFRRNQYY